jgi:hypothetical protein
MAIAIPCAEAIQPRICSPVQSPPSPSKMVLSPAQAVGYLCDATCYSMTGGDLTLADSVFCPVYLDSVRHDRGNKISLDAMCRRISSAAPLPRIADEPHHYIDGFV